ncbi:hypothetical protein AMS68_006251 [Peltaster fructicola]|uniref:SnoaL-like domain-containing protein n=1 Tax=Peltaster fructicola TaxID=286661 RepID=A0A6H0Y152_9PEZI|nr:hypothetical protein AMS68_006251 [Peltaster fructicola]
MSTFDTPWFSSNESFFNKLNVAKDKHIIISGETEDFAEEIREQWQTNGFIAHYVPFRESFNDLIQRIQQAGEAIPVGDSYAVVAFGDAAAAVLQAYVKPRSPRLVAIAAYYPSSIPEPSTKYTIKVVVHLAGEEVDVRRYPEVLGIQSTKTRTTRKRIDSGTGYGGCLQLGFKSYYYDDCEPGFAENDLDEYDAIAADVAFSRSLEAIKRAFRLEDEIESIRDSITQTTARGDIDDAVKYLTTNTTLLNPATLTGGVGSAAIRRYYHQIFQPLPPSLSAKLISRTTCSDRVVDEVLLTFQHTEPIPWLLPGIPASGRKVEIVIVSIACIRGGFLVKEHTYWDQASLLMQIGLLDPKCVPEPWRKRGVQRLPIVGAEAARAIKRGGSKLLNSFIGNVM